MNELYSEANRGRIQPCKESLRDELRYVTYDLKLAAEHSDHTLPLLQARHNIAPGMVLVINITFNIFIPLDFRP